MKAVGKGSGLGSVTSKIIKNGGMREHEQSNCIRDRSRTDALPGANAGCGGMESGQKEADVCRRGTGDD